MKNLIRPKIKRIYTVLSNLPRAISLILKAGKWWTAGQILLIILRGILPAIIVYLTKLFVDALAVTIREPEKSENVYFLLWIGGGFAFVTLLIELLNSLSQLVYAAQAEKLQDYIFSLIHEKSVRADLAFYEHPEYFDHLHRARSEARTRPMGLISQVGSLLQNTITLVAMGAVLLQFGAWLPIILLFSSLPAVYIVLRHAVRLHSWQRGKTIEERQAWYHDWLLTSAETATEVRLFDLGSNFRNMFVILKDNLRKERLQLTLKQRISELLANVLALLLTALAFFWMIWRAIHGLITLGDLALFYQAFSQGQNLARAFLQDAGNLYVNSLFISDLFEFLALEPKVVSPSDPIPVPSKLVEGISFENVSFRYRSNESFILENFNLFIPANKIVAIVGENGAGKSTLIKLLCRFYDPQAGQVKFDQKDVRHFSLEDLRKQITVLFQTPVHYNKTVKENINFGSIDTEPDLDKIKAAAVSAGAHEKIERLPRGYEQMLGNMFPEGTELSIGEWQRIALARAFLRQSPLILLDEPTSAMDPWAESDWIKKLILESKGKTVLLITHRFSTAKFADLIYVMEKGEVVESGSHQELLSINGRYAESWQA